MGALPDHAIATLADLAEGKSTRDLAGRAASISERYRAGGGSAGVIRDADDALAYALARMPATYAAARAALEALAARAPHFAPLTVTDFGCGPGTACLAAMEAFPGADDLLLVDQNRPLLEMARKLLAGAPKVAVVEGPIGALGSTELPGADLVLGAYVLNELDEAGALDLAARAWEISRGALVLVEPGTPAVWARLMAVRARLIDRGAVVAAPCSHQSACPVTQPDWCHFSERLPRSRAHRLLKAAEAPFEDEKYSYVAFVRPSIALEPARPRVVGPVLEDKAAVSLKLCQPDGALELRRVGKRDKEVYRAVRRLSWGDRALS